MSSRAALLACLLAAEAILFAAAARPIARAWPRRFDQATYLARTYELHERMRDVSFLPAAEEFVRGGMPNGVLLPLEAAALFRLVGPSRMAALSVNFAHYAALALALYLAARGITGRAATGFFAVGLLFLARTPFFWPGGLLDFRFDFAGACLYGIFVCAALVSRGLARPGVAALAGLAAGGCVATRFLTLAYLAGLFGVAAAALAFAFARGERGAAWRARVRGLAVATLVAGAVAAPFGWMSRGAIQAYYVGQQFGELGKARAAMDFNRGIAAFLAYYPYTALVRHAGPVLLACAALFGFLLWRARPRETGHSQSDLRVPSAVLAAARVIPALVLTSGPQRQPDVASVLLGPILLACVLPVAAWGGSARGRLLERAGAATAIVLGLLLQASGTAFPDPRALRDAGEIERLHDVAFAAVRRGGLASPLVSVDRITDAFDATIFEAYAFERHGVLVRARHGLGASLLEVADADALAALEASDLVVLTRMPAPRLLAFPFTRQMERLAPRIEGFCASRLVSEGRFRYGGGEVELFRRP